MKKVFRGIVIAMLLFPLYVWGEGVGMVVGNRFNYGLKVGCSSTSLFMHDIKIGDYTTDNYSPNSETGIILSAFARVNAGKFYTETGLSFYSCYASVNIPYQNPTANSAEPVERFSISGKYLQVPLLFGFNIVKQEPYSMALYAGPKFTFPLKNTYSSKFTGIGNVSLIEEIYSLNMKAAVGICFSISNVLLDFGYDLELYAQSDGRVSYIAQDNSESMIMNRSTGVLYFSIGVLF